MNFCIFSDDRGVNPFLVAAFYNHVTCAQLLVSHNCNMDIQGYLRVGGVTELKRPFNCVLDKQHWDIFKIMILGGFDISSQVEFWEKHGLPDCFFENLDMWAWLKDVLATPPHTLMQLCRRVIRNILGTDIHSKLEQLPLPPAGPIKPYLMMHDILG